MVNGLESLALSEKQEATKVGSRFKDDHIFLNKVLQWTGSELVVSKS